VLKYTRAHAYVYFVFPLGQSLSSYVAVAPSVFKNHTKLVHTCAVNVTRITYVSEKTDRFDLYVANLEMCSPTHKLLKSDCTALRKAGWDPHSVEGLGMVDSETLSNLTRAFGDESLELVRNLELVRTRSALLRNLELVRPRSNDCSEEDAVNKKGARRYVMHGQTGIIIVIISTCLHSPTFAALMSTTC